MASIGGRSGRTFAGGAKVTVVASMV